MQGPQALLSSTVLHRPLLLPVKLTVQRQLGVLTQALSGSSATARQDLCLQAALHDYIFNVLPTPAYAFDTWHNGRMSMRTHPTAGCDSPCQHMHGQGERWPAVPP